MQSDLRFIRAFSGAAAVAVVLFVASCAGGPPAAPVAPDPARLASAWQALWSNDFRSAEALFRQELAADPASAAAGRGAALAAFALGSGQAGVESGLAADAAAPADPAGAALRGLVRRYAPSGKALRAKLVADAEKRSAGKTAGAAARDSLDFLIAYYLDVAGDGAKATAAADRLGVVRGWNLLGPFPGVSGSGFGRAFIEEAGGDGGFALPNAGAAAAAAAPAAGAAKADAAGAAPTGFPGPDGRTVAWTRPADQVLDARIVPGAYLGYAPFGSVFYAAATYSVAKAGDYRFYLERSGRIAVWIDGEAKLVDAVERRGGEYHSRRFALTAGEHRILVKISGEDELAPAFRLCLQTAVGSVESEAAAAAVLAGLPESAPGDANEHLAAILIAARGQRTPEDYFWRAARLLDCGYAVAAAAEIAAGRQAGAGESAWFDVLEADCRTALGRNSEARDVLLRSRSDYLLFAPAVEAAALEFLADERFAEAGALLDSASGLDKWPRLALLKLSLAFAERRGIFEAVDETAKAWPDDPEIPMLVAMAGGGYGFNVGEQLAKARDLGAVVPVNRYIAGLLYGGGNYASAAGYLDQILALRPDDPVRQYQRLRARYGTGQTDTGTALAAAKTLAASFPGSADILFLRRNLIIDRVIDTQAAAEASGAGDGAKKAHADAEAEAAAIIGQLLALAPTAYSARSDLRDILGLSDLDRDYADTQIGRAIADYELMASVRPAVAADAEIALDERTTVFFGDGAERSYRLIILKPLSKAGVAAASTQYLDYGFNLDIAQAYTQKAGGGRVEAELGSRSVSFPGLEPGDYLVLRYRYDNYHNGSLSRDFWAAAPLQDYLPCFKRTVRFVYPEAAEPTVVLHNAEGLAINREARRLDGDVQELTFTASQLPAVKAGRLMGDLRDAGAWVDLSSVDSWTAVADWYRPLYLGRTAPTEAVRERAAALAPPDAGDEAAIAACFDYAANAVAYGDLDFQYSALVPKRPDDVLAEGFGDCKDKSTLLAALLAARGIPSHLALSAPDYRGANTFLPSPRFSHAIVVVPRPEGDLILDPTAAGVTFPALPAGLPGTWYLPVAAQPGAAELARIPVPAPTGATSILLDVALDGAAPRVDGSATYRGDLAAAFRAVLDTAQPDWRSESLASFVAATLPGLRLDDWRTDGIDGAGQGFEPALSFAATLPPLAVQGGTAVLDLPWLAALPRSLLDPRSAAQGPLAVDEGLFQTPVRQTVTVALPPGWSAVGLPADARFEFAGGYAEFRYARAGATLVCERELYLPALSVAPDQRVAFADFIAAAALKGSEHILLAVPAGGR